MNRLAPPEAVKRSRKRLRWFAIAVALLVGLLIALRVVIPRIINTERVRGRILAGVSAAVKGDVRFEAINIKLLPRPRVSVADVSLSIPGTMDGKTDSLTVFPEILPLLTGSLRFSRLLLTSPDFRVTMSRQHQEREKKAPGAATTPIEEEVVRILALAADRAPDLRMVITDGRLVLSGKDLPDLSFLEIQAKVSPSPVGLKVEMTSRSNLWGDLSLAGSLDLYGDRTGITLKDLTLEKPELKLSGKLLLAATSPRVSLALTGEGIDMQSAREPTLAMAGDIPAVRTLFSVLRSGRIPRITFQVHGDTADDLGSLENMTIEGSLQNWAFSVPGTDFTLENVSGKVAMTGGILIGKDLEGTLGKSSFHGLGLNLGLEGEPTIQGLSGNFSIVLDEIYPWIYQVASPGEESSTIPASIKGGVDLSLSDLKGPPLKPGAWEFDATADFKAISIETPRIPGPVALKDGNIVATERKLTFTGMQASLLDTSLDASGTVDNFLSGGPKIDVSLNGTMGPESAGLISRIAELPPGIKVQSPVSLSGLRVDWKQGAELGIKGDYSVADGPKGSIDMGWKTDILSVKELSIEDGAFRATIGLLLKGKILDLNYSGSFGFATLQSFFKADLLPGGHINGDLHLNLPMENPLDLTADGRLEGGDFHLPSRLDIPVGLDEFALTAAGKDLEVSSARISWQKNNLSYSGKLKLTGSEVYLDGEMTADKLSLDTSRGLSAKGEAGTTGKEAEAEAGLKDIWSLPLRGRLKFASKRLDLTRFSFEPFNAGIVFTDQAVELSVSRADVCGIAFPGTLRVTPGGSSLNLKASARGEELEPAIACLTDHQSIVTGTYDLDLEITAEGRLADILKSVRGDFVFNARDGVVKKSGMVNRILDVLNLTDVFSGKLLDTAEEGFAYKSFVVKSEIRNGSAEITEGTLDASIIKIASHGNIDLTDMQIDLKVLAAPIKFVEHFANLPIIKQISGGILLAVPMQVEGDLRHPKVRAVTPAAIGSRVEGIFTNILKLPVTILGSGDSKDH